MQACTGPVQHIGNCQCDDHRNISQEPVAEEELAENACLRSKRQIPPEDVAGVGENDGGQLASGELDEGSAEKVAELEFRITIRYRAGLTLHDRIIYQGRIFEQILPAKDINEQHQFLQLTCREKVKAHDF